jgi:hypothetical protein
LRKEEKAVVTVLAKKVALENIAGLAIDKR